ncbi:T9SS type A sorting domain-containing protein [Pedobacter alpinus]|uniref:T9SS type A sorting domain-containing protein n=1 Tax=Pedobacter alpinus TaxID=1590643 RepID=A0ABW5TRW6_9SPHI
MTNEPLLAQVSPENPNAIRYDWYINGQLVETTPGSFLSTYNWPCTSDGEGLTVVAVTSCGATAPVYGGNYSPICYGSRSSSNVELFPNPASTTVNIKLADILLEQTNQTTTSVSSLTAITQIRVIDKVGNVKKVVEYSKDNINTTLDISDLIPDVYYLDITDGTKQVRKPLVVRR